MSEQIMVSILCNVYNHGKYLRDALEGFVMQQTTFPFEVLVHDDASPDNSAEIIREYEEKYPEIIKPIYQTENQYSKDVQINEVFHLPRIKGKYVAACEGDDYWTDPLKLQKQYDFMEANPDYSMCVCSTAWQNVATGHQETRGAITEDRDISLEEIILEKKGRIFQYATIFIRTEAWMDFPRWFDVFPIGDYPLALKAALHGKVRMLADVMAVYRFFAADSWTVRMDNNDAYRADVSRKMIEGLELFNEDTKYAYDAIVKKRINRHKYTLALMEHDLKMLRSEELRDIFKSRSFAYRCSDIIRCKYPKLYNKTMKSLARKMKSVYGYK